MNSRRYPIDVVTAADGTVTGKSPAISGEIIAIHYLKDSVTPFTDGVDFAATLEATGQGVWTENNVNASATRSPRQPTHDQSGVASLYAAAGAAVTGPIVMAEDRLLIAVSSGGDTKKGSFILVVR